MTQIKLEEEQKMIEEQKRIEEEKLLESKTFTPVTKELFDEWYKNFLKKVKATSFIKPSFKVNTKRKLKN